jgi:hypothetical protein
MRPVGPVRPLAHRRGERLGDGVRAGLAGIEPVDRFPPPLQPDLAEDRVRHRFPHLGDFLVEGVEGQQLRARRRRCEHRGQVAVVIGAADFRRAEGAALVQRFCVGLGHAASGPAAAARLPL